MAVLHVEPGASDLLFANVIQWAAQSSHLEVGMAATKDAKVVWKGGLAFEGIGGSGLTVSLDTPAEEGGGSGFSPMELL
jgi:hypothetical protein